MLNMKEGRRSDELNYSSGQLRSVLAYSSTMPTLESVRGRVRGQAALCAALITAVAVCIGDAVARSYPFGSHTRNVSDLGNQFIPFHAHLWDLLHGKAD